MKKLLTDAHLTELEAWLAKRIETARGNENLTARYRRSTIRHSRMMLAAISELRAVRQEPSHD